jgi:hypothetical protein
MFVCALSSLFSFQSLKGLLQPKDNHWYYVTTIMLLDLTKSSFIFINHFCWSLLHDLIFSFLSLSLTQLFRSRSYFQLPIPSLDIFFLKDAVKWVSGASTQEFGDGRATRTLIPSPFWAEPLSGHIKPKKC